jgi:hypothetical protein
MDISVKELEERLETLWNRADKLSSDSDEYEAIVNEVLRIRNYCRENHIGLSDNISSRF